MIGGYRRWFSEDPPGKSSGRLRQKLLPACTSLTPSSTLSDVMRLIRPSSSSSPQSPQVEPSGRRPHRFATADPPYYFVLSGQNNANRRPGRDASPGGAESGTDSGPREGDPFGGDHERELAREEVRLVGPRPSVGLGGGARPPRGAVIAPRDGGAGVGRRTRLAGAGRQVGLQVAPDGRDRRRQRPVHLRPVAVELGPVHIRPLRHQLVVLHVRGGHRTWLGHVLLHHQAGDRGGVEERAGPRTAEGWIGQAAGGA